MSFDPKKEPLLNDSRMNLFPIKYPDIWQLYKQSVASFWVPEEITLTTDINDWEKLEQDEKHFILMILGFFACSDFIVNDNLDEDFCEQVKVLELKMFYHFNEMMEDIHSNTYQLIIDTLVKDKDLKNKLFNATININSIKKKSEWAKYWIKNGNFVERLIAFACVEGIMFSSSFCSIFWLKKQGLMPGLAQSNELISRDEGIHRDGACLLYKNYIVQKLEEEYLIEMIKSCVKIEKDFVNESLPYNLKGMNKTLMCQYVEYVADHLCVNLINKKIYLTENPFPWMNLISVDKKVNFFENRSVNYSKTSVITSSEQHEVRFDEEF
jgi:ribonucleoside-diphosphate reductase beta chain